MNLKQEFQVAWRSGEGHEALLELVRCHQRREHTREQIYTVLEEIWLEHGYDNSVDDSTLQNDLECVMEQVWYHGLSPADFGPPARPTT